MFSNIKFIIACLTVLAVTYPVLANAEVAEVSNMKKERPDYFAKIDTNSDSKVSLDEYIAQAKVRFAKKDKDSDGFLTKDEMRPERKGPKGDREAMKERMKEMRDARKEAKKDVPPASPDEGEEPAE